MPPLDTELIQLRVQISLSNEVEVVRYIEVEIKSGEISELNQIENLATHGIQPFTEQIQLLSNSFSDSAVKILAAQN